MEKKRTHRNIDFSVSLLLKIGIFVPSKTVVHNRFFHANIRMGNAAVAIPPILAGGRRAISSPSIPSGEFNYTPVPEG
jgi:hypothetical protein